MYERRSLSLVAIGSDSSVFCDLRETKDILVWIHELFPYRTDKYCMPVSSLGSSISYTVHKSGPREDTQVGSITGLKAFPKRREHQNELSECLMRAIAAHETDGGFVEQGES